MKLIQKEAAIIQMGADSVDNIRMNPTICIGLTIVISNEK